MGDLGQVAQDGHRVGPVGVLFAEFHQRALGVARHDHVEEVEHPPPVSEPQHRADLIGCGFACPVAETRLSGQGIGSALVVAALRYARNNDLKAIPSCPFVASYVQRHPEWNDVVIEP